MKRTQILTKKKSKSRRGSTLTRRKKEIRSVLKQKT